MPPDVRSTSRQPVVETLSARSASSVPAKPSKEPRTQSWTKFARLCVKVVTDVFTNSKRRIDLQDPRCRQPCPCPTTPLSRLTHPPSRTRAPTRIRTRNMVATRTTSLCGTLASKQIKDKPTLQHPVPQDDALFHLRDDVLLLGLARCDCAAAALVRRSSSKIPLLSSILSGQTCDDASYACIRVIVCHYYGSNFIWIVAQIDGKGLLGV